MNISKVSEINIRRSVLLTYQSISSKATGRLTFILIVSISSNIKYYISHIEHCLSLAYLEFVPNFLGPLNDNLTQAIRRIVDSYSDLHLIEPTHASLSKTFVLKFHWIENFFKSLREKFKTSSTKFLLELSSDVVYLSNDEGTRYFACILASEWCNSILSSIIENVDSGMREFNLPLYYENPSFHVSVIWKLTEFTEEEKSEISLKVKLLMEKHNEVSNLWVDAISVKSGNKLIRIPI